MTILRQGPWAGAVRRYGRRCRGCQTNGLSLQSIPMATCDHLFRKMHFICLSGVLHFLYLNCDRSQSGMERHPLLLLFFFSSFLFRGRSYRRGFHLSKSRVTSVISSIKNFQMASPFSKHGATRGHRFHKKIFRRLHQFRNQNFF